MKATLFIIFLFMGNLLFAQEKKSTVVPGQHSFYAELGGPGILFSANIDTRFTKSNLGVGGRIGLGFVTGDFGNQNTYEQRSVVTVPVQINYIFGKPNSVHSFEVGGGATFLGKKIDLFNYSEVNKNSIVGTASFMYRRQPQEGGFSWRLGFTPIITSGFVQASGAASIGYNF
ncbi:MAG: hypothetical protein ABIP35_01910 [Ginsengibacter sp.]